MPLSGLLRISDHILILPLEHMMTNWCPHADVCSPTMDEEGQEICQAEPHPSEDTGAVQVLGQHLQALYLLRWQVQIITSDVALTVSELDHG